MNKSTAVIGSILILFGLFFLLQSLDLIWFDFGDLISVLFPVALIAAGVWLIGRRKKAEQAQASYQFSATATMSNPGQTASTIADPSTIAKVQAEYVGMPSPPPRPATSDETGKVSPASQYGGKIRYHKVMGDMFIDCEGLSLGNIEVSGGVGDVEIKVSGGVLAKGLNRIIVSGFIGDIRIFVPRDIAFFAHCSSFVGDVEISGKRASGFGNTVEHQTPQYDKSESKLYIASNSFIGDMKIYQV